MLSWIYVKAGTCLLPCGPEQIHNGIACNRGRSLHFAILGAWVMSYVQRRNYENLQRAMYDGVGEYGIPAMRPADYDADNWIGFNYAKGCDEPEKHGVHFFIDDYQFNRVWTDPDRYLPMLRRFQCVCTPDFSTYTDFPKAVQIFNHYRKHWLGAYWQENGIAVIPTISWSDEDSFAWCFDGEPVGGTVAVSSVGTQISPECAQLFELGFMEMARRLQPTQIVMYGKVPDVCLECGIGISEVKPFHSKWRKRTGDE